MGDEQIDHVPPGVGPKFPQVLVLVGGTGDLAQRKLWPGLFHLVTSRFIPACQIIGVSLDEIDVEAFRALVRARSFVQSAQASESDWACFAETLDYVPLTAGPEKLKSAMDKAELALGVECRRLHYLSVPPNAALSAGAVAGARPA